MLRGRKLNICIVFIKQPYFAVPKNIRILILEILDI